MNVSFSHYRRLLGTYLAPQRKRVAVLAALMLVDLTLQLLLPRVVQGFIDSAIAGVPLQMLLLIGVAFLAVAIGENWTWVGWQYVAQNVGLIATNRIRADLTLHCLKLDMGFHNARTPGEMIERVDGDVNKLGNFLSQFIVQLTLNGLLLMGVLVMLLLVDWRVAVPTFVGVVFAFIAAAVLTPYTAKYSERERQASAELFGLLEERLSGTEDIRANGAVAYVLRRHIERSRQMFFAGLKRACVGMLSWRSLETTIQIGAALSLAAGAVLALDGALSIGQVYLVFAYTDMIKHPVEQLTRQFNDLQQATASIARVQALFNTTSVMTNTPTQTLPIGPLAVTLHDVSFGYDDADPSPQRGEVGRGGAGTTDLVLRDISVCVPAGGTLGLLGRTGSGKTTLTRLLLRLYDPSAGQVHLNGVDVRDVVNADLRARVAVVTQDIQLFSANVRDNLTFFDSSIPDTRILAALDELGMGDWVRALPKGLDTVLASGGTGLSAGEAQLLAFARAFLRDPGLVILDEASSRLDPATERKLEHAVDKLLEGRTGIIIAHRLDTVQRVDQIMILDDGRVLECGVRVALMHDPDSRFSQLLRMGMEEALV
jgi:ABC-type multidrug transport system fused ATPase/permease subunit